MASRQGVFAVIVSIFFLPGQFINSTPKRFAGSSWSLFNSKSRCLSVQTFKRGFQAHDLIIAELLSDKCADNAVSDKLRAYSYAAPFTALPKSQFS